MSLQRFSGQVAVVTGASSGIGAEVCRELVGEGLKVIGLARRKDRLDHLACSLRNSKGTFHPYPCDISSEESILEAFTFAKTIGPIHILINNAGKSNDNSLVDGDTGKWREILDINVLGLCIATREAIKDMKENGVDGHIVHINSIIGHKITVPMHMYGPSKFAVTALAETLRLELVGMGSKIKVTSVSPGLVRTEFQEAAGLNSGDSDLSEYIRSAPCLKPEDVAGAVVFALSTPPHVQVHELTIKPVGEKI